MPNFDQVYASLLSECGSDLVLFLDSFFGFLHRNSDFFQTKTSAESIIGFSPGQNKSLLLATFNKWNQFSHNEALTTKDILAQSHVPIGQVSH